MQYPSFSKLFISTILSASLIACGNNEAPSANNSQASSQPEALTQQAGKQEGVIAKVEDQVITYDQLSIMLNSSAMVGLSIPALGTPDRNKVIITLLDKVISANLIYLDAKDKGVDRQTKYVDDLKSFEDAVLIAMYKDQVLIGEIPVTEQEVLDFYKGSIDPGQELTDDVKLAIESKIRDQRFNELKGNIRERVRADTEVKIFDDVLSTNADADRSPADVVARFGDTAITWSDVEVQMRGADFHASNAEFYLDADEERLERLQQYIDNVIMVDKAKAAGMDKTPEFARSTAEYRKTHLITYHRGNMIASWQPSDDELKSYYLDHMDQIVVPERRKVQMVVVKTKEEAQKIKDEIDSGKITMYKAAQEFSLDPNAKRTLGEMGWVNQGTGFEGLDEFTFNLEPDVVSGPVESPAGWHLVKVLDVIDAQRQSFDDAQAQKTALRMYMKEKYDDYVVDLRKNHFDVVVYDDELNRQFREEAEYIAMLTSKAKEEGSVTEQRQEELKKWIPGSIAQDGKQEKQE